MTRVLRFVCGVTLGVLPLVALPWVAAPAAAGPDICTDGTATVAPDVGRASADEARADAVALPRFMPACEINRLDLPQYYEQALPGLRAWAQVTDTILVITAREPDTWRALWPRLQADVPDVRFVPGLKLSGHPSNPVRIDDLAAWRDLAEAVAGTVAATGSAFVLLDTESGRYPWLQGEYEVESWADVLRGMACLPRTRDSGVQEFRVDPTAPADTVNPELLNPSTPVTYILYPPVGYAATDARREKTERFVRTFLRAHPSAWLVTFQYATRATPNDSYYQSVQAVNESLAPGRCLDIAYTYRDTGRVNDWQPAHLPRLLAECPRPVLVYGHWGREGGYAEQQVAVVQLVQRAQSAEAQATSLATDLAGVRVQLAALEQQMSTARTHLSAAEQALQTSAPAEDSPESVIASP